MLRKLHRLNWNISKTLDKKIPQFRLQSPSVKMQKDAGVNVVFLNESGEQVDREYIDCYKCDVNGATFTVPSDTHKVKVYFSTEGDHYMDSDGESGDGDDVWHYIDIDRIFAACKEEINMNDTTREYWAKLKCEPDAWATCMCIKGVDMEKDRDVKEMLKILTNFEKFIGEYIIELPPKSILEFLELMANIETFSTVEDESDLDYKTIVKIIMECFEEGAAHVKMKPAEVYTNDFVC